MYNRFYGFAHKPFSLTPDPDFLYLSPVHKRALAYLNYGLEEGKGFIQITGEIGSGKTTLVRSLLRELKANFRTAYIINPMASFDELLKYIITDLGIGGDISGRSKIELLDRLYDFLLEEASRDGSVAIIFDEAQDLSTGTLEEIRLLSNFETTKGKLVQIALIGQPELRTKLSLPELKQLKQRISVSYHIGPLDHVETQRYIMHRIGVAKPSKEIVFTQEACDLIHQYTEGIPRVINIVCDAMLLTGFVEEQYVFDAPMAEETISELASESGLMRKVIRALPADSEAEDMIGPTCPPEYAAAATSGVSTSTHPTYRQLKRPEEGNASGDAAARSLYDVISALLDRQQDTALVLTPLVEKVEAALTGLSSASEPEFQKRLEERLSRLEELGTKMEQVAERGAFPTDRLDALESKLDALSRAFSQNGAAELQDVLARVFTAQGTLEETMVASADTIRQYRLRENEISNKIEALVRQLEEEGKNLNLSALYFKNVIKNVYGRLNDIERKMWKKPTWLRNLYKTLGRVGTSHELPESAIAELTNGLYPNQSETQCQRGELDLDVYP